MHQYPPGRDSSLRCKSRPPVEVVFMIHWRRGRFPPEGLTRHRGPGSDVQPLQTAGGSNSSLVGGGVLRSGCGCDSSGIQTPSVDASDEEAAGMTKPQPAELAVAACCPKSGPHIPLCPADGEMCGRSTES